MAQAQTRLKIDSGPPFLGQAAPGKAATDGVGPCANNPRQTGFWSQRKATGTGHEREWWADEPVNDGLSFDRT